MSDQKTDALNGKRPFADTKPISEQVFKEIRETRRELSRRLDRIEAIILETRSDLRDVEDRLDRIEPKLGQ